jgi:molybdate/tungstate transport system substrate-binding protein
MPPDNRASRRPIRIACGVSGAAVALLLATTVPIIACQRGAGGGASAGGAAATDTLVVFNAGSLTRPFGAVLDSFSHATPVVVQQEGAGSLETARKLTDLQRIPDVIGLADYEVFPNLLMPKQVTWYAQFARNRMVIAYGEHSKFAADLTAQKWPLVLQRPGVEVGRADPNQDPNGYRTLMTLQLAERYYKMPGLYKRLTRDVRNVRPKSVDLVALLQAGELDYIWAYESVATAAMLKYLQLPDSIDLGEPADSAAYAVASVVVRGKTPQDSVIFHGQPIVYGVSIPVAAPHAAIAQHFLGFLLSPDGQRILRAAQLDALNPPVFIGDGVPAALRGG